MLRVKPGTLVIGFGMMLAMGSIGSAVPQLDQPPQLPISPSPTNPMDTPPQPMLGDHRDGVVSVAFSPDGRLATGETDGMARIWDAQGRLLMTLKASDHGGEPVDPNREQFPGYIWDVVFSPDGTKLGTRDNNGTIRIWDEQGTVLIEDQGAKGKYPFHPQSRYVVFSPNSDLVAVIVDELKYAKLWTIQTQQWVELWNSQREGTIGTEFSPDGSRLVTFGGYSIRLWDSQGRLLADPKEINVTRGNPLREGSSWAGIYSIFDVVFSPDNSKIVVLDYILDAQGQVIRSLGLESNTPIISRLEFSSDSRKFIFISSWQASVGWIWSSQGQPLLEPFQWGDRGRIGVAGTFSPDSSRLVTNATLQEGDPLKLWNSQGEQLVLIANLEGHQGTVSTMAFSPNSQMLATSDDYAIRLWSQQGQLLKTLPRQHVKPVLRLQFSPDSRRLISHGEDYTIRVWDVSGSVGYEMEYMRWNNRG